MKRNHSAVAVGHVGLNVSDLDVSNVFYQEVFGFTIVHESIEAGSRYACLARDRKVVLTLWEQDGGPVNRHPHGLHHLAFEAASTEQVNRTKGILENLGIRWSVRAATSEGLSASVIHFEDPDGIQIELYNVGTDILHEPPLMLRHEY